MPRRSIEQRIERRGVLGLGQQGQESILATFLPSGALSEATKPIQDTKEGREALPRAKNPRGETRADQRQQAEEFMGRFMAGLLEREFQAGVLDVLTGWGFTVWVFPVMIRTTAGVPDLTFWHQNCPGRLWMWELKTETGRVRPKQADAIAHLSTVGGVDARIVRPSEWAALRDALIDQVLSPQKEV